jgi:hypothetical protein
MYFRAAPLLPLLILLLTPLACIAGDPYAHHKTYDYFQAAGTFELVETAASAGVKIFRDTSHCANPTPGSSEHEQMKKRYGVRAFDGKDDPSVSAPALEGTLRSRCVPKVDDSVEGHANTAFTDQCLLKQQGCTEKLCHVTVGNCPARADSTTTAPRWAHSGHDYKKGELIKYHDQGIDGGHLCLMVREEEKVGKAGHFKAVPYLTDCPPRGGTGIPADFSWYLEPRVGTFVSVANGMCLTLKARQSNDPAKSSKGLTEQVTLRPCNREEMPISQSWDLYATQHRHYHDKNMEKCKAKLPTSVTEYDLKDFMKYITDSLEEKLGIDSEGGGGGGSALGSILGGVSKGGLGGIVKKAGATAQTKANAVVKDTVEKAKVKANELVTEKAAGSAKETAQASAAQLKTNKDAAVVRNTNSEAALVQLMENHMPAIDAVVERHMVAAAAAAPPSSAHHLRSHRSLSLMMIEVKDDVSGKNPKTDATPPPPLGGGGERREGATVAGVDANGGDPETDTEAPSKTDAGGKKGLSFFKKWSAPVFTMMIGALKSAVDLDGSYTQGVVYGLPLNAGYYKMKSDENYNCHKLPLAAHANQRYGLVAVESPSVAVAGWKFAPKGKFCLAYNPCTSSYMVQITPELAATLAVGPLMAASLRIAPSFGIGVSFTGKLERALSIPLWDGSRDPWIDEEFILLDTGHFWMDLEMAMDASMFIGKLGKGLLKLELQADIMVNVNPRQLNEMQHKWTKVGEGFVLHNKNKEKVVSNLLVVFARRSEGCAFFRNAKHMKDKAHCVVAREFEGLTGGDDAVVEECKRKCDKYDECRFISVDPSAQANITCTLFKRANVVKARTKKRKIPTLMAKYGVTGKVQSFQSNAAFKPIADKVGDSKGRSSELSALGTCGSSKGTSADGQVQVHDKERDARLLGDYKKSRETANYTDPTGGGLLGFLKRAAFTASVQGKVHLAMHLGKITFGMIEFDLTLQVAGAIRKGNVPNAGFYLTVDMSGKGKVHAKETLAKYTEKTQSVVNGAVGSFKQGQKQVETKLTAELEKAEANGDTELAGKLKKELAALTSPKGIQLQEMDVSKMTGLLDTGVESSALMQLYIKDMDNFGFKTGVSSCVKSGLTQGKRKCTSHFFIIKRVKREQDESASLLMCYSNARGARGPGNGQECTSNPLQLLARAIGAAVEKGVEAVKAGMLAVVNVVKSFAELLPLQQLGDLGADALFVATEWAGVFFENLGDLFFSSSIANQAAAATTEVALALTKGAIDATSEAGKNAAKAYENGAYVDMVGHGLDATLKGTAVAVTATIGASVAVATTTVAAIASIFCFGWC